MKPVDEHCRTQRLNFLFFLLRSSLSVHVAMKTGSSSIRGSCSTCSWQEKGAEGETEEYTIAEKKWCFKFFQGNTVLALFLYASPNTKEQTHFHSMLPSNKNQSLAKHTLLWMATLHVVCKCCNAWLSLLTISYSLTSLQIVASTSLISCSSTSLQNQVGHGGWRLLVASFSKLHH